MSKVILVYITCKNRRRAEEIGRTLVEKRLVACSNIIDGIHSQYLWPSKKGALEETRETLLLAKTVESKWKALEREVKKLHSYDNPAILAIPVTHVSKKYHDWLVEELTK